MTEKHKPARSLAQWTNIDDLLRHGNVDRLDHFSTNHGIAERVADLQGELPGWDAKREVHVTVAAAGEVMR